MRLRFLPALAALAAAGAWAQSLEVYSEFQRVDPFGEIVPADRAETPREILSPALVRNAFTTLQVVVRVPHNATYSVFLAQNPENAFRVTAYRPVYVKRGAKWIPDGLEPVKISPIGRLADLPSQLPAQSVRAVWLDVWVPPGAQVRRTRMEVQLNIGDQWIIYPLELRTQSPVALANLSPLEPLAAIEASAADTAAAVLRGFACGAAAEGAEEGPPTIRRLIRRNARQDVALARAVEARLGKPKLTDAMFSAAGVAGASSWCKAPAPPPQFGAEWYLRVRDLLRRQASASH